MAWQHSGTVEGRRLYVSRLGQGRRGVSTRLMLNEAEVAAAMAGLGFEVIEPEQLNPAEQIATFASADIVVGPAGSGMFNVVFCRPGTKVLDIESEPNWIYAHTGLFASCRRDTACSWRRWTLRILHRSIDGSALMSRLL